MRTQAWFDRGRLSALLGIVGLASCLSACAPTIKTLHASAPYGPQAEQLMAFGRLVGSWDLVVENRQEDGSFQRAQGEWHFGWILQGRAIQDVWTVYRPGTERGAPDAIMGYGTTVRAYDAKADVWHVNWMGVLNHNYTRFQARAADSQIIMDAVDDEGDRFQWIFHDVTDTSFRWRSQSSPDGGQSWEVAQRMTATRRR